MMRRTAKKDINFASFTCLICLQAKIASTMTIAPTKPETILWLYSMIVSMAGFVGITSPKHKGHVAPHPSAEPVLVTNAPCNSTIKTPIEVRMPNTFKRLCIHFHPSFYKNVEIYARVVNGTLTCDLTKQIY